jgi:uncharacterized membrane protein
VRGRAGVPLAITVAAIVCAAICATVQLRVVDAIFACPLVLYLPGAAIVSAAGKGPSARSKSEELWWSVLASIGATILGGLILNVAGGLTRIDWLLYLSLLTIAASGVAWWRLGRHFDWRGGWHVGLSFVSLSYRTALLAVAATALCGGAIGISVYSNATANQERFVQLWILPAPLAEGDYAGHLQVGLENHEGRTATFDVVVTTGPGRVLTSRHIELRPNGVWKKVLTRPKRQAISATVALSTEPTRVLNSVKLAKPARV